MRLRIVLILIGVLLTIIGLTYVFNRSGSDTINTPIPIDSSFTLPSSSTATAVPLGEYITVQTPQGIVTVKNFYTSADLVLPEVVQVADTATYAITYFRSSGNFLINLKVNSLVEANTARSQVETILLDILGLADRKEDACKFYVDLHVDPNYNATFTPNLSSRNFGLSFCPGSGSF